jgi:hypothetical protein
VLGVNPVIVAVLMLPVPTQNQPLVPICVPEPNREFAEYVTPSKGDGNAVVSVVTKIALPVPLPLLQVAVALEAFIELKLILNACLLLAEPIATSKIWAGLVKVTILTGVPELNGRK